MTSQSNDSHWQWPDDTGATVPARPVSARLVDPEDPLPASPYAGDFVAPAVPSYPGSYSGEALGHPGVISHRSGFVGTDEALPYVQPQSMARHAEVSPVDIDLDESEEKVRAAGRRGTQHLGLLTLRIGLGGVLLAHGLQKLFGWWNGQGLVGFKNALSDIGYQHADILAYVSAGGEIVAGVLLVLGLFTPLAAAGALAFLINGLLADISALPSSRMFPFFLPDGQEYQITLIVMAVAVILVGPGRYGLDAGRGWARRPFIGSFVALLAGIGAGVALWVLLHGANPLI
ncbi:MAG: DoxX family protein [Mycobacteriaceae bacterium]|nr:DoxX family protein [Mycobacteriaceae bacterium]